MQQIEKNIKPLGGKAYGSIPHLPGSRLGPGDHHCESGQARIATERARDRHDLIIVQEKLDGSNVAVAKINGQIMALTRSGYMANTSKYDQHIKFEEWVMANKPRFDDLLQDGERLCGEWLYQAHGTLYNLPHEPFVAFDIIQGKTRLPFESFVKRINRQFTTPNLLSIGQPFPIDMAIESIKTSGHGAVDEVEGAVWRVERRGVVDFLTKFVHHHKQDGKYLPENNGTGLNVLNNWQCSSIF